MKKLLLSSIIMFGVCGFVTAQNATETKGKQPATKATTTNSISPAPQKSAVVSDQRPASDAVSASDLDSRPATTEAEKLAATKKTDTKTNRFTGKKTPDASKTATTVNEAGEVVNTDEAAKKAAVKKTKDN